jgi:hypothetical protein
MELEVIRMVTAGLSHGVFGVNAKLPGVPRDAGDLQPPNVTIYNSTNHGWVTRREINRRSTGASFPALAVSIYRPAPIDGEIMTIYRDGEFDVLLEYLAADDDSETAGQDGLYTMRATLRTLAEFHRSANAALRARNGVELRFCKRIGQAPIFAVRGDVVVTAALLVTYAVRDTQPYS